MKQPRFGDDRFGRGGGFASLVASIGSLFAGERDRWSLWLAVAIGVGVGLYFSLPHEPPSWRGIPVAGAGGLVLATLAAFLGRGRPALTLPALAAAACALGFVAAQARALAMAAPVIERQTGVVDITGRVVSLEERARGPRVTLDRLSVERLSPGKTPGMVRLTLLRRGESPPVGSRIGVKGKLMPPPELAVPGGFQFARQAWFAGLGGVGYALSAWRPVPEDRPPTFAERVRLRLGEFRHALTMRLMTGIGGEEGAIAAALVTGERGAISSDLLDAYRDSGIAHLLSISGLHMSMVSGLVFVGVRGLLALIPFLALRFDIKKGTALAALLAAFAYLLISGADVPTQRSFLMVALVLAAVLLDRTAISMRSVAWAAAAVMLWQPESVIGPSFQMSFAAVTALVATYEALARKWRGNSKSGWGGRIGLYVGGILLTTLVAGTASSPYAAYHFNRFTSYSLVTNLAVIPLTGLFVMPPALLGTLLMPLGLEAPALWVMGQGIAATNAIAREIASWPGATFASPPVSTTAIVLVTLGGLWLCLWRRSWRVLGLAPIALGLLLPHLERLPDVLVSGDGRLMAVRAANGGLSLSPGRGDRMAREEWAARYGGPEAPWSDAPSETPWSDAPSETPWSDAPSGVVEAEEDMRNGTPEEEGPENDPGEGRLACDSLGCLYDARGRKVALVRTLDALAEDCAVADVVISAVPARRNCRGPDLVIDRFDLWHRGAHALWLEADGARVETAAGTVGDRPWAPFRWRKADSPTGGRRRPPPEPVNTGAEAPPDAPEP